MLDLEQYNIGGSTAREIAGSVETSVRKGELRAGDRLPTVRELAGRLGTSPATVNSAYRILRERGLVIAEGRRGTRVAPRPAVWVPTAGPVARPGGAGGRRDLAVGLPDPALLPPVGPALARIDAESKMRLDGPDPELIELARASFAADGLRAETLAVTSGAFDAFERVLQAHLRPGDRVMVEDPTYPPIRDLLLALGLVEVPVPIDERGFQPEPFAAALKRGVEAITLVPRAQNPLGAALDPDRQRILREILEPHPDPLLVEDDHASRVAGAPFASLVTPGRPRWAVIRSSSKVLHPDLRLAVTAGDVTTISRVEGRQALGPRWVSHVLQTLVVALLRDPAFDAATARAQEAYAARRADLMSALAGHGIASHGRSGLNVWVPVREEAPVVRALYEAGWLVMSGERFRVDTPPGIRITVATLQEGEAAGIAQVIAQVEHAGPRQAY
jgi:DNA-binding transcriptional MocR family regulator